MVNNKGSRVFHCGMVAPLVFICFLTIISMGSFTSEHMKIRTKKYHTEHMNNIPRGVSADRRSPHYCILFTESRERGSNLVELSNSPTCSLAIWGGVSVFLASLMLAIVLVAKALYGVNMRTCFSAVELFVILLMALLDFSVAVVLSAGLDHTCSAFGKATGQDQPCSYYYLEFPDNTTVSFYGNLITAKATAWIGTIVLDMLTVIYFILLCSYCWRQWCLGKTDKDSQFQPLIMSSLAETEL